MESVGVVYDTTFIAGPEQVVPGFYCICFAELVSKQYGMQAQAHCLRLQNMIQAHSWS